MTITSHQLSESERDALHFLNSEGQKNFVDRNMDLLQNIEFAVVMIARKNPKILDQHISEAYTLLRKFYMGKVRGWDNPPQFPNDPDEAELFSAIIEILNMRTGHMNSPLKFKATMPSLDSKVAADCFEKLISSVKKWSRGQKKSQRYLDFISKFV